MNIRDYSYLTLHVDTKQKEFEDTKGAIRIRISKKNRQHNDQKKKYKRTNWLMRNILYVATFRGHRN